MIRLDGDAERWGLGKVMGFAGDSDVWRPLRDPRWWSCLGVLLLNDHVLKSQALALEWLGAVTGKLSDVCGLVVAPVLCAVIARRFSSNKWLQAGCFMLPALVFVALNLSTAFTEQWMAWSRAVGFPQQVWSDWTDLLALPATWLAWRVVKSPRPPTPSKLARTFASRLQGSFAGKFASRFHGSLAGNFASRFADKFTNSFASRFTSGIDSLAVAMGAFACLATSSGWEGPSPHPSLRNVTAFEQTFSIRKLRAAITCATATNDTASLNDDSFLPAVEPSLGSGEQTSLVADDVSSDAAAATSECIDAGSDCDSADVRLCGAAVVSARHMEALLVTWDLRAIQSRPVTAEEAISPGSVYIERFGSELRASPGEGVELTPWAFEP